MGLDVGTKPTGRLPDYEPGDAEDFEGKDWTERQRSFVRRLLQHGNASRACREAGYSDKRPEDVKNYAYLLQQRPHIKQYLARKRKEAADALKMDADIVLKEIAKIAMFNASAFLRVGDDGLPYYDLSNMTVDQMAAIGEVSYEEVQENQGTREEPEYVTVRKLKFKPHDKLGALNSYGRHLKLFTDRQEVVVEIGDADEIQEARKRAREAREAREKDEA